ncbi:MAG: ABC transporter ATP-binding protein [Pseudomonadales bacterium RIFCSPLOWO2_12_60_38]|jgi:ATP-binding cassette subfamily B protein|uniref:ABC transporter ATP-binding protein n=1 Tax=Pseudomonas TaxID=286 RepID=UPI0003DC0AED|nr:MULTISPECIES: ABC transporter ATP-binding protein [unclassified Pseudomonas]ETK40918.1 ABC transporter ATP-binding protein [Pseudomonas fluorescens FH5]MBJ2320253.1 ABC transporter ATP-binding protein [Pseudomonas fluorescens]OHC33436.1 MAG: ABC transporter ATP-binding protein [Pseudomonadales bacterium RIFCSPLOWO2_12_60_38]OHC40660.1 MAG: ABC transporter ATP-binding protein [Pseudomonadales bacterium RIFCSPLOWO2_12_FULL_59_450]PMZ72205.1 ABC transporter ATP-binding protein [Pseudomonas sp.
MLKTFNQLLGEDARVLRRYLWMTLVYGLLCGLTIVTLVPVLTRLLNGDVRSAGQWLTALVIGVLVCWALRRTVEKAGIRVGIAVLQRGRHRLGDHVARLPVGWFSAQNTARLSHLASQGMMELAQLPAHVFTPLITGVVTPVVIVAALFNLHWQIGLIALLALPLLLGIFALTAHLGQRADQRFQHSAAQTSQRMVEFAQAQSVLRAFNGEDGGTQFLEQAIGRQQQSAKRLIHVSAMSVVFNAWAVQAGFAVLLVAATLWLGDQLSASLAPSSVIAVIVSLLLVSRFIDPLLEVAGYSEVLRGARGQLDAVREIFEVDPLPEPQAPQAPVDGSVVLENVSFCYAEDQADVLRDVSLRIEPGSMTALVGASGSGKTTLVRLIARFFDVTQGRVMVGGVDVRQMSSGQLAGQISQIFQDAYLFQGSIADNIRIGKPDATDAQVMQAATQAGVLEIIERLPQGLDTPVGEGGARLSGGERQRISIARALIKEAPILLVDEATAALDAENQAAIAQALARLRGTRTLIVIAHQLSTVVMADQILVLDHGQISEQGSHAQLNAKPGLYAHFLAQRQAAKGWRIAGESDGEGGS